MIAKIKQPVTSMGSTVLTIRGYGDIIMKLDTVTVILDIGTYVVVKVELYVFYILYKNKGLWEY